MRLHFFAMGGLFLQNLIRCNRIGINALHFQFRLDGVVVTEVGQGVVRIELPCNLVDEHLVDRGRYGLNKRTRDDRWDPQDLVKSLITEFEGRFEGLDVC